MGRCLKQDMEPVTDIQKTDRISRLMEGSDVRTNPFGENKAADRAYRRAERLAGALFLLTKHISLAESIRSMVRTEALQLLEQMLELRDEMRSAESITVLRVQSSIRKIISHVRIMAVSGFISPQNADIAAEALDELGNFLSSSQRSTLAESVTISKEGLLDVQTAVGQGQSSIKDKKDISIRKDTDTVKGHIDTSFTAKLPERTSVRKKNILEVLRSGGMLGIRDIASALPEYSEKMIQRELFHLISTGEVTKMGHKRWSLYSLAH